MKTILHVFSIGASSDEVWKTLSSEEGLAGWWSTQVSADIRLGGLIKWTFEGDFNPTMEITELRDGERMGWTCIDGHEPWAENTFSFEIKEQESGSQLWMRQEYAREMPDEAYGIYNYNWGYYMRSLQRLAETGSGFPFEPPSA